MSFNFFFLLLDKEDKRTHSRPMTEHERIPNPTPSTSLLLISLLFFPSKSRTELGNNPFPQTPISSKASFSSLLPLYHHQSCSSSIHSQHTPIRKSLSPFLSHSIITALSVHKNGRPRIRFSSARPVQVLGPGPAEGPPRRRGRARGAESGGRRLGEVVEGGREVCASSTVDGRDKNGGRVVRGDYSVSHPFDS